MNKIKEHISASQISDFLECSIKYRKKHIEKEELAIAYKEYIIYGSAIHRVLEKNYRQKIESRVDLDIEELIIFWRETFQKECNEQKRKPSEENVKTLLKDGEAVLRKYMKEVAPNNQPIAVELEFIIHSERYGVSIKGYIDMITEEGVVVDFKTVGSSKAKMWTQKYVDNLSQLTMYALAYRMLYKKPEKCVRIEALENLKGGPKMEIFDSYRTNNDIQSLGQLMKNMKKLIELGLFYPNLTNCKDCDFTSTCNKLSYEEETEKQVDTIEIDLDGIDL